MTLGLKDLYYAVCTEADGAESYGAPKKMAEAMSADLSVKTADGSLYADTFYGMLFTKEVEEWMQSI